jgi:hypothetical protein
MLKTCPSCSYIGNDGEHTCPFCKADLALTRPKKHELRSFGSDHATAQVSGTRTAIPGLIACFHKSPKHTVDFSLDVSA